MKSNDSLKKKTKLIRRVDTGSKNAVAVSVDLL